MKRLFQSVIKTVVFLIFLTVGSSLPAFSQQGIITTFAGGGPNGPIALSADIFPQGVAVDSAGNIFIAGLPMDQVLKVDAAGNLTVVAGTGAEGISSDGGPATSAALVSPPGVAVDTHGNLFIVDGSMRIRRVDAVSGIITTVAGNGQLGYSGDGGPATSAKLNGPYDVALDAQGNLFISDVYNQRIRRADGATGMITTVAGNGQSGFSGDGGSATSASLSNPIGVAVDANGDLFIADLGNQRIRRVDAVTGDISTVAGGGSGQQGLGDGGPATSATMIGPFRVAVDTQGNLFIADSGAANIRRVDAKTQIITTVAGAGTGLGPTGDNGPATNANLVDPEGVAVDGQDDIFIADVGCGLIRRVDGISGIITTVAGGGSGGEGSLAKSAILIYPVGVAIDEHSNVFISEPDDNSIRRVDGTTGIITTAAGSGAFGNQGNGGPPTSARLRGAYGVAVDTEGNLLVADSGNNQIRRVDAISGIITLVAGNGQGGFAGDGSAATNAGLAGPFCVALDAAGNIFIGDSGNNRIRRVDGTTGIITTVAGNGKAAYAGDGGPAINASLNLGIFGGVALDLHGNLFIADWYNNRVRRVDATTGTITTIAGTGNGSSSGDGGLAIAASIVQPMAIAVDAMGNIFISAPPNVRRVDGVSGIITTVAGDGTYNLNFDGDGGPATSASLNFALGLAVDSQGRLFVSNTPYNRIRVVPLPPFVALSADSLSFTSQAKGTTTAAQTITLTNTGLVSLTLSSFDVGGTNAGDFAQTNNCGGSLGAGANCTINVTFTSTAGGSSTATLTITDGAPGSPHAIELTGAVQTQNKDFSLAVSGASSSATVTAGGTATYDLSITPLGGLSGAVSVTCSEAPSLATCTVSPASVNLSGSAASPITVTVSTTARSGILMSPKPPAGPWVWVWILALLAAVATWMMAVHRPVWQRAWVPLVVVLLCATLWTACGGGNNLAGGGIPGTPSGTYTLTVTGNMGSPALEHNVALTLNVN